MNAATPRNRKYKADSKNKSRVLKASGECDSCVNVGAAEREASMIGGTILAVCGLLKGSVSGLALAAIGGALIYRGHTGRCQLYQALGHSTADE
jgi:uncharacterized membrane protein